MSLEHLRIPQDLVLVPSKSGSNLPTYTQLEQQIYRRANASPRFATLLGQPKVEVSEAAIARTDAIFDSQVRRESGEHTAEGPAQQPRLSAAAMWAALAGELSAADRSSKPDSVDGHSGSHGDEEEEAQEEDDGDEDG